MTNICPNCEKPIIEGDHIRFQGLAVFHKAPIPDTHAVDIYQEEVIEHLGCSNPADGD